MVYLGRRVVDCIKVFQEETLAVINPLTGASCLYNKYEYRFQWALNPQLTNMYHS